MLVPLDSSTATIDLHQVPAIHRESDVSSDEGDWILKQAKVALRRSQAKRPTNDDYEPDVIISSFSDQEAEPYVGPIDHLARKQAKVAQQHREAFAAAKRRIEDLKGEAQMEGLVVSAASEKDLLAFLDTRTFARRPYITLLDNGNLRALWKNDDGEQIGLQFRGNKQVQYVLFVRRAVDGFVARSSGRDTLSNIGRQIEAHDLAKLMVA